MGGGGARYFFVPFGNSSNFWIWLPYLDLGRILLYLPDFRISEIPLRIPAWVL